MVTRSVQPKSPAVAVIRQNCLSSTSCRASVTADLVDAGGNYSTLHSTLWLTTGMFPFLQWLLTISRLGADSKDLTGWYGV